MQNILFRGKSIENDEWVYGAFTMSAAEKRYGLDFAISGFIRSYDVNKGKSVSVKVRRETVGQYTGREDKNGRKIYAGDILKRKMFGTCIIGAVVLLDLGGCGFFVKCGKSYYPLVEDECTEKCKVVDEVVGDLYTDPVKKREIA